MKSILLILLLWAGNNPFLPGTWTCVKTEDDPPIETPLLWGNSDDQDLACQLRFHLDENGTGIEHTLNQKFTYQLKDSVLTLGNRKYLLEKLSPDTLIMKDYDQEGLLLSTRKYFFVKED